MREQIDEVLSEVLTIALGRPIAPGEEVAREDEPTWDSLKHLQILFAIEDAFGIHFSVEEMASAASVSDLKAKVLASHSA